MITVIVIALVVLFIGAFLVGLGKGTIENANERISQDNEFKRQLINNFRLKIEYISKAKMYQDMTEDQVRKSSLHFLITIYPEEILKARPSELHFMELNLQTVVDAAAVVDLMEVIRPIAKMEITRDPRVELSKIIQDSKLAILPKFDAVGV